MGNRRGLPNTNEIASFMRTYAPETASSIAQRSSEYEEVLTCGIVAGEVKLDSEVTREGLKIRAEVIADSLSVAVEKANLAVAKGKASLRMVKRLRFTSAVLASVTSAGALSTLLGAKSTAAAVVAMGISLITSVIGAASDVLLLGGPDREAKIAESIQTLSEVIGQAGITRGILSGFLKIDFPEDEMRDLIGSANAYFGQLNKALNVIDN